LTFSLVKFTPHAYEFSSSFISLSFLFLLFFFFCPFLFPSLDKSILLQAKRGQQSEAKTCLFVSNETSVSQALALQEGLNSTGGTFSALIRSHSFNTFEIML
jgi:hypothetical protein